MKVDWAELFLPSMRAIRDRFHETVGLAVLDEAAAIGVIVDAVQETGRFGFTLCAGHRFPIHTGAPAKAILAFLPQARLLPLLEMITFTRFTRTTLTSRRALLQELSEIKACGYALDRAEEVEGCHCLAVPIFDAAGLPVAGVWFTGPSKRLPLETLKAAYPEMRVLLDQAQRVFHARLNEQSLATHLAAKVDRACHTLASEPFDQALNLSELAQTLGMSYSAFRHAFKAHVGTSPAQYRLMRRLHAAQQFLECAELSQAAIAKRTGFPSATHFSTVFKKKFRMSPRDYRATYSHHT
jgi:DNA-binding IclR family transcriptional regulator